MHNKIGRFLEKVMNHYEKYELCHVQKTNSVQTERHRNNYRQTDGKNILQKNFTPKKCK